MNPLIRTKKDIVYSRYDDSLKWVELSYLKNIVERFKEAKSQTYINYSGKKVDAIVKELEEIIENESL